MVFSNSEYGTEVWITTLNGVNQNGEVDVGCFANAPFRKSGILNI